MISVEEALQKLLEMFDPRQAEGWDRVVQLNITGADVGIWQIVFNNRKCSMVRGRRERPDLEITTDIYTFTDLATGKLNGTTAYLTGRISADGPIDDLLRFGSLFPGAF